MTPKPKLSEIKAREQRVPWTVEAIADFMEHAKTDIPHLLKLVKRLGKVLGRLVPVVEAVGADQKTKEAAKEARALLLEIKE